jgi:uncharacterized protein YbjT (DUF2867 family)
MRFAVAGSTGVVGRLVVAEARTRGHDVRPVSRSGGIDVTKAAGLDTVVDGVDAVIDTLNVRSMRKKAATDFYTTTTANLLAAERRTGVPHHVVLSIVGIDRLPLGYYQAKLRQEQTALAGPVPVTIQRTTQFHEFAGQVLDRMHLGPLALLPRFLIQPVAAQDVAVRLCDLAERPAAGRVGDLAGPEQHQLPELARRYVAARGLRRRVLAISLPPGPFRAAQTGALLPGPDADLTTLTFDDWLRESRS